VRAVTISVVIPTRDRPALLARAVASVQAQTHAPLEILVVDDGASSVAPARASGARVLANPRTPGPSGARNAGAAAASGDLLAFLDDDDEWLPSYLATAAAEIAAARLDVLCTDLLYRYDDGSERPGKPAAARLVADDFLTHNPGLIGSNLIIRRALYTAVDGFDESLAAAEDMDFGLRLSLLDGVRYAPLHQRLVRHHQHTRPRLCMRRGDAMRAGIRRFFALHGGRMSAGQRAQFADSVRKLWGFDEFGRDCETAP